MSDVGGLLEQNQRTNKPVLPEPRELFPILGQARHALHFGFVQNQHHERFVWYVPLTSDVECARSFESESWIVFWMAQDYNERTSSVAKQVVASLDQFAPDAQSLIPGQYGNRTQSSSTQQSGAEVGLVGATDLPPD